MQIKGTYIVKCKVTIYDNTLNPVVTKTPHFPQRINNIYEFHTACKGLY